MAGGFIDPSIKSKLSLPTSRIEISLRCSNLSDCDYLTKSDPVAIIFGKSKGSHEWRELWRSEMLLNDLNPKWTSTFVTDYCFEEQQPIKIEVHDWDTDDPGVKKKLKDQDLIGRIETTLANLVASKQFIAVLRSKSDKGAGTCVVSTEEMSSSKEVAQLHFAAKDLDNKDTFGKSDPFMIISRSSPMINGEVTYIPVHQTNVVKNTLKPSWDSFNINLRTLCNGDYERLIKFDVYDWDDNTDCDLIGSFSATFNQLKNGLAERMEFVLVNPKKAAKKSSYKNSGKVYLKYLTIEQEITFLDYIQAGTMLNFSAAIDFTASNGDPNDPDSLHYLSPEYCHNQYTQAIQAVGEIIEPYDTDKQFPALGFGAVIPPNYEVSYEFFLNLTESPFCQGVHGILQAYRMALGQVQLAGPTYFTPIINHAARFASTCQDGKQYCVLLIITDGIITDLEETKAAIVDASKLPLSIIVIGVGDEDFSAMEALDSDKGLLKAQGKKAARDIVQFVEMKKFMVNSTQWDKEGLAKEILAEVPKQLVRWMSMNGIKPVKA